MDTTHDPRELECEANLLAQVDRLVAAPGLTPLTDADLVGYHSEVAFPLFNAFTRARVGEDDERAAAVLAAYVSRGLPFMWWSTPSFHSPALDRAFRAAGAEPEPSPAMHLALVAPLEERVPAGLDIVEVTDADWDDYIEVMIAGFEFPVELTGPYAAVMATLDAGEARHVLARLDGRPVCVGTLFLTPGVAGLYNITTLPEARGRGIGYAVTARMVNLGRAAGAGSAVLYASESGLPVYERLGFSTVGQAPQYVWSPAEA